MQIQQPAGADVIFAFDELTTLLNTVDTRSSPWPAPKPGRCGA